MPSVLPNPGASAPLPTLAAPSIPAPIILPLKVVTARQAGLAALYGSPPLAIYFIHGSVYMSFPIFQFIPPPLPHVHTVPGKHLHPCEQYAPPKTGTRSLGERRLCYPPAKLDAGQALSS